VAEFTQDDDRIFPGSPTHLRGWSSWAEALQEQALRKLCLTHKPETCNTPSSDILWLEKHVAQIE